MKEVRANKNIVYRCWYHVVWCPKWRRKVLTSEDASVENPPIEGDPGPVDVRLREIIEEVAEESGSIVEELEVGKFIRLCKGRSSRLLRAEFPSLKRRLPTLWTNSYFVATVGGAPLSVIAQYIENQRSV
jgi:putative transposase